MGVIDSNGVMLHPGDYVRILTQHEEDDRIYQSGTVVDIISPHKVRVERGDGTREQYQPDELEYEGER